MKILILNGPNLNLLGKRESSIYGTESFESFLEKLKSHFPNHIIEYRQSNIEGEIINYLQEFENKVDGIVLNAGAYTHTSIAIADCIRAISTPVVEVHISNIFAREIYRQTSFIAEACKGTISGFGLKSYQLAIQSFE